MNKPHSTVGSRMAGINEDWLSLTTEDVLEPDLAIIDPHHHLWDFVEYPYLLEHILADTAEARVGG